MLPLGAGYIPPDFLTMGIKVPACREVVRNETKGMMVLEFRGLLLVYIEHLDVCWIEGVLDFECFEQVLIFLS